MRERIVIRVATVALLGLALTAAAGASAAGEAPAPTIDVSLRGRALTVAVREAPLARVLRAIGETAGLDVTLRGDLGVLITRSLAGVPLDEGIRSLARGHSIMLVYRESGEAPQLTGVWVIAGAPSSDPGPHVARPPVRGSETHTRLAVSRGAAPHASPDAGPGVVAAIDGRVSHPDPGAARHVIASHSGSAAAPHVPAPDPDSAARERAIAALGALDGAESEWAFADALADENALVRLRAVRGLRTFRTETAIQSLARVLAEDEEPRVRMAALRALASHPGRTTLQALANASGDPDAAVREAAMRGLAWWESRSREAR